MKHRRFYKAHKQKAKREMKRIKVQSELDVKDIAVRALKTFVQAFFAALAVSVATVSNTDTAKVALVGAVAAGISAVMNTVKGLIG
jgi:ABC-type transporter Mla MlaB component